MTELVLEVVFDVFCWSGSCKAFVFKQHATSSGWRDLPHVTQITRSEDSVRVVVALLGFNGSLVDSGCEAWSWAVIVFAVFSNVELSWPFCDSKLPTLLAWYTVFLVLRSSLVDPAIDLVSSVSTEIWSLIAFFSFSSKACPIVCFWSGDVLGCLLCFSVFA